MGDTNDQGDKSSDRSKALLIGIQYKGQRCGGTPVELKGPCEDVKEMSKYLISTWDYPKDNIFELIDEPNHVQPTRTNILKYLKLLVQASTSKTRLFLYYSGHACQVQTDSEAELDGKDEAIIPLDWKSGPILDDVLYDHVVNRLPPGCRFTAVFDCCHSGTLLDLPCTSRERPPLMNSDELSISSVMTMYFTAQRQRSTSSPPEPVPDVRQGVYVKEKSGKKLPLSVMTHQELSDSPTRSLRGYMKLPTTKASGPKAHWFKKWFQVLRKPACANTEYSIAFLPPLTSQLAATHPEEVGYSLRRQSIDGVFTSPIRESFNENEYQLPWELPTQTSEEPASRSLDMQSKRLSESHPLSLPTVFSIGACADSDEVMEGRTTNAGLLRSALIQCIAETKDRTWEQLLEDLWVFTKSSPEFSETEIWPVIGSMKKELTDIVAF